MELTGSVTVVASGSVTNNPPELLSEVPGTRWFVDRVLIIGGWNEHYLDSATLYDPSTDSYNLVPNMGRVRTSFGAALICSLVWLRATTTTSATTTPLGAGRPSPAWPPRATATQ
jgi:hypothetical protein